MTPKQEAALRQALDCVSTLANARDWVGCTPNERWDEDEMYAELCNATICLKKSLSIIQEALAEQPAQQEPQRWAVFCQGCRKEWSVSYPHPGKSICAECDAKVEAQQQEPATLFESFREFGEGWESLAWELCADENGEEACSELIWEGGPIPEPWGDRWLKYEDEAKRLIALVHKHTSPPASKPLTREQVRDICKESGYDKATMQERADFINGIRHAEAAHGIKGGA